MIGSARKLDVSSLMRKFFLVLPLFLLLLSCHGKQTVAKAPVSTLDEPDRVLFERAGNDMKKGRLTVSRLTLQTLINTYPDSDYLPQAKYMMAESFFRDDASSSSLSQAADGFKDFITFFPADPLAADAQMKIAMTEIRRMEKPDRDQTHGRLAALELTTLIESYPDSRLQTEAKEKLRAVQEVLADGTDGIGDQYFRQGNYIAAISRYKEIMTKYPDYSRMPETLFNFAESLRRAGAEQESISYYARIVTDYPLSQKVADAKHELKALNQPIPEPNPVALARAQAPRDDQGVLGKMVALLKGRPSVPRDTEAASSAATSEETSEPVSAPVRGGVVASPGNGTNAGGNGSNSFSIDPKIDGKGQQPAKKPQ
jgi:outer membrane protein assembly factor BamD